MITIDTVLGQMLDIYGNVVQNATYMLVEDGKISFVHAPENKIVTNTPIYKIPRNTMAEMIEKTFPDNWDVINKLYGEYNCFGVVGYPSATDHLIAWYDRTR